MDKKKKKMIGGVASLNGPTHHEGLKDEMSQSYSRGVSSSKQKGLGNSLSPKNKMPKVRDY